MKNLVFSNSTAAHKALKFHKTCKKDTKVLDSRPLSEGWKSSIEIAYLDSSIEETNNFIQKSKIFFIFWALCTSLCSRRNCLCSRFACRLRAPKKSQQNQWIISIDPFSVHARPFAFALEFFTNFSLLMLQKKV